MAAPYISENFIKIKINLQFTQRIAPQRSVKGTTKECENKNVS